jgi:FkbM family methyltransferase
VYGAVVTKTGSGEIHVFEVDPRPLKALKLSLQKNDTQAEINQVAVSQNENEVLEFTSELIQSIAYSTSQTGHQPPEIDPNIGGQRSYQANSITLDSYADENKNPDVIKMDIEGFEHFALSGATNLLEQQIPKLMIIEIHQDRGLNFNKKASDTVQLIRSHGYHCYLLQSPDGRDRSEKFLLEVTIQPKESGVVRAGQPPSELTSSLIQKLSEGGAFRVLCTNEPLKTNRISDISHLYASHSPQSQSSGRSSE